MRKDHENKAALRSVHRAGAILTAILAVTLISTGPAVADAASGDASKVTPKMLKKCQKCHGEGGISDDPESAHLVGQPATYIYKQLQEFKSGAREGGRMNKTARKLSDQQHADLAAYFSSRELPAQEGVTVPAAPPQVGSGEHACGDCHGDDGRGKKDKYDAPALAGMPLMYFEQNMQAFRDGERNNDADGIMGKVAKALNEDEITALAEYYLALGNRKPIPPL